MSRNEVFIFGFRGFPDVQGGIETHVQHLAPRLVARGHRVTACMRSPYVNADPKHWRGVRLLRLWTIRNAYLETLLHSLICAVAAGLRRPALVHVHGIGPALVTPLLRLMGLRVIVTHHGEDYDREKWGFAARTVLRVGELLGMRFANKRIAISCSIERLIVAKYGKPCDVIPNGVQFSYPPLESDLIETLGLEPGRYLLTVGRLVPEKRQLDVVRAFAAAQLPNWKLAIVGRIDHENAYADQLVAEAAKADNVVMTGFQSGDALRQLYAHAGLFVLPSSHEGLPIVLLEALSYGLPVLVSDIPSNLEVITDRDRTFAMGDVADLAAKLIALTDRPQPPAERHAIGRENIRDYDWSRIAELTVAAYAETLAPRRRRPPEARLPTVPRQQRERAPRFGARLRPSHRLNAGE